MACNKSVIKPTLTAAANSMNGCNEYDNLRDTLTNLANLLPDKTLSSQGGTRKRRITKRKRSKTLKKKKNKAGKR